MYKVQQGLNLESTTSIIDIDLKETENVTKLLDLIKGFHPIFIEKYQFKDNHLSIQSHLVCLWRDLSTVLISLSKGELPYTEAEEIALQVIKERVASMSTIPLLYTAQKLGYEITPTMLEDERVTYTKGPNRIYTIGVGKNSQIVYSISSSKDSKEAKEIQRDKWQTNLMMQRLGLPIPKWQIIDNLTQLDLIWDEYEKPVVIKPTGLTGGHGVVVGIKTFEKAKEAYRFAKKSTEDRVREGWQTKIMIQEQVQGDDYRLLVINGKLEIATKRIPAFITGDGKHNIKELIEETNTDPRRDLRKPTHTLKPIRIDESLLSYLKDQKLTLEFVPKKDERIYVRKVASMSQGGVTEDYTDKVSPEIKAIVESIASSIHAFTVGVDVMCQDISRPLTKENGAILEVNTMPEAYLNIYPVIGRPREEVFETYIKALLDGNNTKRIVVIGHSNFDIPTLLRQKFLFWSYLKEDDVVGEYKDSEIRINSLDINDGLEKWKAVEALKVNASLDAIIINHRDWEDVKETGLGFNKIDLLCIEEKYFSNKECMKVIRNYRLRGLISKIIKI